MKQIICTLFLIISFSLPLKPTFAKEKIEEETLLTFCQRDDLTSDQLHTLEELKTVLEVGNCEGLDKISKDVSEIYLYQVDIKDVSPLQFFTSLEKLDFGLNEISDLSPLQKLTSLKLLSLYNNKIRNISTLRNLTSLTELNLFNNQIKDLSPLKGLKFLKEFEISKNPIIKDPAHCPIDEGVPPEIRKFCTDYLSTLFGQTIRE